LRVPAWVEVSKLPGWAAGQFPVSAFYKWVVKKKQFANDFFLTQSFACALSGKKLPLRGN